MKIIANWPGTNWMPVPKGRKADLYDAVVDDAYSLDLVVVVLLDVACDQLAVDVEADPDRSGDEVGPSQRWGRREDRFVQDTVSESGDDEESGRAVQQSPACVPTEQVANLADTAGIATCNHGLLQPRREQSSPTRQDRPQCQHPESGRADDSQRSAEGAGSARGQEDVRRQQQDAEDRDAAVPDRGSIDTVEPPLNDGQRADQHQHDGQEQDRHRPETLTHVARGEPVRRPGCDPEDHLRTNQAGDRQGTDIPAPARSRWPHHPRDCTPDAAPADRAVVDRAGRRRPGMYRRCGGRRRCPRLRLPPSSGPSSRQTGGGAAAVPGHSP